MSRTIMDYFRRIASTIYSSWQGMTVTLYYFLRPPVTVIYPYQRKVLPERVRGTLSLKSDELTDKPRCIGCKMCEKVCPNNSIHIELEQAQDGKKTLKSYIWDMDRCIFCGLCVETCRFDSLYWVKDFEFAADNRKNLTHNTQKMMETYHKGTLSVFDKPENKTNPELKK